jgi:hypothetical protein
VGKKPLLVSADDKTSVTIELIPKNNLKNITDRLPTTNKQDLKSWVTFPLTKLPLHVCGYTDGNLTVCVPKGSLSSTIYPYDELHYLRVERFQTRSDGLNSEELKASSNTAWMNPEALVEGVLEMWFEWTPSEHRLEVWILASGGDASFGKSSRPLEWPAEAPWRSEFEQHDLAVVRQSWLLRNI